MKEIVFVFFSVLITQSCAFGQDIDSIGSKHEKWEFILEDVGDISQIALPLSAGIMTLIEKDYEVQKNWHFHMVLH